MKTVLHTILSLLLVLFAANVASAANKTFTGPGNFSDPTKWSGGTLPGGGDNLRIDGTCTFDNAAANLAYGMLEISRSATGTLQWPVGGTNTLNVSTVRSGAFGAGTIDMTNGGTLRVRTNWTSTNTALSAGTGTIHWNVTGANSTLPTAVTIYNNLNIDVTGRIASLGASITVNGNLQISAGTFNPSSFAITGIGTNTLNVSGTLWVDASTFPGNYTSFETVTLNAGSSVDYSGTVAQTVDNALSYSNLTLSGSGTKTLAGNISPAGDLAVNGATFNLSSFTADRSSLGGTLTVANGATLKIGGTNSFPANYSTHTLGLTSTVEYNGTTQTVSSESYGNLTIGGSGTANSDFTVNGALTLNGNLAVVNPNALTMGASATTTGLGDVTGIVKRTSFVANTSYSFGNQFTTATFPPIGTLPTDISVKITIGSAPSWKTDAIQRTYDFIHTGGSATKGTFKIHYLDSELNGNTEANLVIWNNHVSQGIVHEHGKSGSNATDNWVELSNVDVANLPTGFDSLINTLANTVVVNITWNGSASLDWTNPFNWTGGVPIDTSKVVIPDAATTPNDPTLPANTTIRTLTIQTGGVLNGGAGTQDTIAGGSGAWVNNGTFNPGTSTVIFTNSLATISGATDFRNVTIAPGAQLTLGTNNIMRIAGTMTNLGSWRAGLLVNTVEYNGANQTVLNPNGGIESYHHLIFSGSGIKTMPASAMTIAGNFTTAGTASATAAGALTVNGNVTVGSGTSFDASTYTHILKGNFTNDGTFMASTGTVTLNGSSNQTLGGSSAPSFNNLTVDNSFGISLNTDVSVNGVLTLSNGNIVTGPNGFFIGSAGSVSRTSGHIVGNLRKNVGTGAASKTFEIGNANSYTPINVSFGNVTTSGNLTAATTAGDHPNISGSGINSLQSVNRYWRLTNGGIVFDNYSATFNFVPTDVDSGSNTSRFVVRKFDLATWSAPTTGTRTATSTQATGLTSFSEFAIGEAQGSSITLTSGNNQSGVVGTTLADGFVVTVTDTFGNPVQGVNVSFAIASVPPGANGQSISVTDATSDAAGQASTVLTLGDTLGTYTVSATSAGLTGSPVTFTATGTAGIAKAITLTSGNNQVDTVSQTLPSPFVVTVSDTFGNPVQGINVVFAIDSIPSGTTGQVLSVISATTDTAGSASTFLTLGNIDGRYTVTATSLGLMGSPVTFAATAVLVTGVDDQAFKPSQFQLFQNYPNPFNPSTEIQFDLKQQGHVQLMVYDVTGRMVDVIVDEMKDGPARHTARWQAGNRASGVYFLRLVILSADNRTPTFISTKRMLLLK